MKLVTMFLAAAVLGQGAGAYAAGFESLSGGAAELRETLAGQEIPVPKGYMEPVLPEKPVSPVEWIKIPGGKFMMGTDSDVNWVRSAAPMHEVGVKTFQMSKTEVTVEQYNECVKSGACTEPVAAGPNCNWGKFERRHHPVNCVNLTQAREYARFKGGRLPSEAEWEYAATGGGRNQKYPWGNTPPTCDNTIMMSYQGPGCGAGTTWPVCSRPAGNTAQGLCDMAGNVTEWVQDMYTDYSFTPTDGSAYEGPVPPWHYLAYSGGHLQVLRGGNYHGYKPEPHRADYRSTAHIRSATGVTDNFYVGFRIAR